MVSVCVCLFFHIALKGAPGSQNIRTRLHMSHGTACAHNVMLIKCVRRGFRPIVCSQARCWYRGMAANVTQRVRTDWPLRQKPPAQSISTHPSPARKVSWLQTSAQPLPRSHYRIHWWPQVLLFQQEGLVLYLLCHGHSGDVYWCSLKIKIGKPAMCKRDVSIILDERY